MENEKLTELRVTFKVNDDGLDILDAINDCILSGKKIPPIWVEGYNRYIQSKSVPITKCRS